MRKMQTTHPTSMRGTFPKIQETIVFLHSEEKNAKKTSMIAHRLYGSINKKSKESFHHSQEIL
jgi:hypothetical protein